MKPMPFFVQGSKDAMPLLLGLLPFAVLTGVSAIQAGMTPWVAQLSSLLLMSGASQIAAATLMTAGAAPLVVIVTHIAINFRYAIYSAGLSQLRLQFSPLTKLAAAQVLIDQTYALTFLRCQAQPLSAKEKTLYYFGTALPMWLVWQTGTAAGILAGPLIPAAWHLEFAITLCFISLLVPMLKNAPIVVAAAVAGLVSAFTCGWPYNLGFLFSMAAGVLAGGLYHKGRGPQRSEEPS
ncbi:MULTISPECIES: AzlC family ABC transporter permease [Serratia]|jgi:predicted branched-subunit amino acid permease|uniref:AzlC family ABC transporter permease n=1 Tax=Serratia surfactantfaciens TaxID=2741499 RepID=A0ABS0M4F6_9GAMM|nr:MULTISPECIES: AzlC family ABC transporter permease [Serratia]WMW60396.1 AzlC family ABC transporter permease [Serratia marcescens]AOF00511.1 branched-chain amino acid transport protein AzlC [Serratia surfactantfaciens]MBH1922482.1 AzlC family ABC transporter permease [Serratia surfactantfaciens]MBI6154390.1 AzlC family ABC transporter permease [Serratia surfactantfaciens]MTD08747.1 branched-chain amino acid transport protein AzlC [Serratia sp. YC16]